jgi:hypothetical protein
MVVRSSLFPHDHPQTQREEPQDPLCFNLCCIVIMVIGLVSLSLCVYLVLTNHQEEEGTVLPSPDRNGHFLFIRKFNI